jgi:pimeloyl-ACP methyl ester carboxylesterase
VQTWGLGRNVGFHAKHANALEQKIRYMHHRSGQKVSLVGWSLGGVFALYGAHQAGECVRSVITLGSPISVDLTGSASPALVKAMYRLIAHPMGPAAHSMQPRAKKLRERAPLGMPLSCLYSLSDGVVPPQEATVDGDPATAREHPRAEQPRGPGLQRGGVVDRGRAAFAAAGAWRPFEPSGPAGARCTGC